MATPSTANMNSNLAGYNPCREIMLHLRDGCMYEGIDLLSYPPVPPGQQEAPVKVVANDTPLTTNKINIVDATVVKNVLLPAAGAEKDVFVLANQTPQTVTLKAAATDTNVIASVRGGSLVSFRYIGGKWTQF